MQKMALGKTGFMVSEFGVGGIPLTRLEMDQGAELIHYCFEQGVNFFDTSPLYEDSELKMGLGLEKVRDQVILATKTIERGAEEVARELESSLKRLRTDYIDLYQLHHVSRLEDLARLTAPGGGLETVQKAMDQGVVRHLGVTSHNLDVALRAIKTGLFETVQVPFNFVETDALVRFFPAAFERNMGVIAMKPFAGGLLESADMCINFLRRHPRVLPIPGVQSREEVDQILAIYKRDPVITQEMESKMARIKEELGQNFCHRCGYCQPCPQGVNIPAVLMFPSQTKRFPPAAAARVAGAAMESAGQCVDCGECEEKCPYGLPVAELVAETLEYFKRFKAGHGILEGSQKVFFSDEIMLL